MARINVLLHEDARSRNFSCLAPFFKLPPQAERGKENLLLLPTEGIEPRPPAQQASALSITPLLFGLSDGVVVAVVVGFNVFADGIDVTFRCCCFQPAEQKHQPICNT